MFINNFSKLSKTISENLLIKTYLACTTVVFIYGSIGEGLITSIFLAFCLNIVFIGILLFLDYKISLPKGFLLFLLFLAILFSHSYVTNAKLSFAWIFASGATFWLIFYNIKDKVGTSFFNLFYLLSTVMTILFLYTLNTDINSNVSENLFHPTATSLHNHLGDIVAISLIPLSMLLTQGKKWLYVIFAMAALVISFSYSRSAILAFMAGFLYLRYFSDSKKSFGEMFRVVALGVGIFILFGISKTTFSARPYYLQAISLLPSHILGIGVGNFGNFFAPTQLVHSMLLEIIVGMGLFSIVFIVWITNTVRHFGQNVKLLVYEALFLGILTNLLLDRTYAVPSVIWIWLSTLGMLNDKVLKKTVI